MSTAPGSRYQGLRPAWALAPLFGLVLLAGCTLFENLEDNPSPNPETVLDQDLDAKPYPNLAEVPDKPPAVTPEDIRANTVSGLEADRANAQYTQPLTASDTSVRSAQPPAPPPVDDEPSAFTDSPGDGTTSLSNVTQATTAVAAAGVPDAARPGGTGVQPSGPATPSTPRSTDGITPRGSTTPSGTPSRSTTPSSVTPSSSSTTNAPTVAQVTQESQQALAREGSPSASQTPGAAALAASRQQRRSGDTVAALPQTGPTSLNRVIPPQGSVGGGNVQMVGVIFFGDGSDSLDARDETALKEVASIQRQYGGILRVVGHASSQTANLPQQTGDLANLNISFDRAERVSQALQRAGVPADRIVVEGMGDRQPRHQDASANSQAGNRRAEIFLEY